VGHPMIVFPWKSVFFEDRVDDESQIQRHREPATPEAERVL
jgi:hypothetical protein